MDTRPLAGFRTWFVQDNRLCSVIPHNCYSFKTTNPSLNVRTLWPFDRQLEGKCYSQKKQHTNEQVPEQDCSCGMHGYYSSERMIQHHSTWACVESYRFNNIGWVAGAFTAHGRIVLHERGFRAQYGRPLVLFDPQGISSINPQGINLEDLSNRYNIPILGYNDIESYVTEFAQIYG